MSQITRAVDLNFGQEGIKLENSHHSVLAKILL